MPSLSLKLTFAPFSNKIRAIRTLLGYQSLNMMHEATSARSQGIRQHLTSDTSFMSLHQLPI
ncbi:Protein of unknown function [Pyronema omphalodes CBS 100304]|uniref:Uncharacterized protein n=1 Tax=Pyronema omphalodes (strain CBS 100304) TaxID=1076935 RepID=U4LH39_PYROM|nr:Protein of unknown function [Pyronema omphalodes CBS 100304]